MGDVIVAQPERLLEAENRLVGTSGQSQRAGQIVAGEEIHWQTGDETPVELERPLVEAAAGGEFPKHSEDVDRVGAADEDPLEEIDVEVELAEAAEPGERRGL